MSSALANEGERFPRVLLVDDEVDVEHLFRQRYRRKLRKKQLEFHFAQNGVEALDFLAKNPDVDLVITDINMPVMDGLTLLGEINARFPMIKSVIVSAYHDMRNIRLAMNRGAFDFLTKPIDFDDFEATLNKTFAHVRQIRTALRSIRENHVLRMFVDEAALTFMLRAEEADADQVHELVEATIAFIDISSFSTLMAREEPSRVVSLLNTYFDRIVADVLDGGGAVDKFIGDAVMAVFRDGDHLTAGVRACLAARDHIGELRCALQDEVDFAPNVSIGINSGKALLGNIGAECVNRYDFTVVGEIVNSAAHLQTQAPPGEIFVPVSLRDRLSERFLLSPRGSAFLKGQLERQEIFAVDGERDGDARARDGDAASSP